MKNFLLSIFLYSVHSQFYKKPNMLILIIRLD